MPPCCTTTTAAAPWGSELWYFAVVGLLIGSLVTIALLVTEGKMEKEGWALENRALEMVVQLYKWDLLAGPAPLF